MRAFRVFNDVSRVDVEWTILGQRYQFPSMSLIVATLATGAAAAFLINAWVAAPLVVICGVLVVFGNWRVNQMNPTGALGEVTQLRIVWRTARRPIITTGRTFKRG